MDNFTLNEINHRRKSGVISLIRSIWSSQTHRNTHSEPQQTSGCQELREGREEMLLPSYRMSVLQEENNTRNLSHNNVSILHIAELHI